MADETDGRSIVARNDYAPALTQMIRDGSSYYLMAYTSSAAPRDGKFHQIQVRVKRKDVDVRARKGYWAISPDEAERALGSAKPSVPEAVSDALNALGGDDTARRGAANVWLGASRGESGTATVTLAWEAAEVPMTEAADRIDHLQIVATSAAGATLFTGRADRSPQADRPAGQVVFDAPPGPLQVRIELQNASNRRLDTSDTSIDVPDYTATTAQVTNPFVYRGRTARDIAQIRAAKTPLATPSRSFARTERVLFRFDAYGPGGALPTVTARLLNQNGDQLAVLPPPTHTTGNTFEIDLFVGPFPPGSYVVEIAAAVPDSTVKRVVAFRVTG
jgi:hypothetical protein